MAALQVGALNACRLEQFRERYRESALAAAVQGPATSAQGQAPGCEARPFMYGTHYSSAGFVLYYLVSAALALTHVICCIVAARALV